MRTIVSCEGLEKTFGSNGTRAWALRGVDLEIRTGEITFITGPSGCGKTTLISTIAGLLDRTGGTLSVLGEDPARLSRNAAARFRRERLGFIFQHFNLLPSLTAAENVAVPLLALGVARRDAVARGAEMLRRFGMAGHEDAPPRTLSGGQMQRVAIARALVHEPELVLCDEPTAALDAHTGHSVMEVLASAATAPNRAVVVVTHDNRIYHLADRIVEMEDGRVTQIRSRS